MLNRRVSCPTEDVLTDVQMKSKLRHAEHKIITEISEFRTTSAFKESSSPGQTLKMRQHVWT